MKKNNTNSTSGDYNSIIKYDYSMSLYAAMVTIRVMDAIKEEFPESYPEKSLYLTCESDDLNSGIALMDISRSGHIENKFISDRKAYLA